MTSIRRHERLAHRDEIEEVAKLSRRPRGGGLLYRRPRRDTMTL
jgi:hypothetical protein